MSPPPDRRVWLWHPGPLAAPDDALIGWRDVPLADAEAALRAARALACQIRAALPAPAAITVHASDRTRARRPARALARALGARLESAAALREIDYGAWEGLSWAEVRRRDAERHAAYMADWRQSPMPDGESHADLEARVAKWWTAQPRTGPIVVVADAGALRALAARIMGWTPEETVRVALARGSYAVLDPDGRHPPRWNLPPPG